MFIFNKEIHWSGSVVLSLALISTGEKKKGRSLIMTFLRVVVRTLTYSPNILSLAL